MTSMINGPHHNGTAPDTRPKAFAYRPLAANNQQERFQQILGQTGTGGNEGCKQGINAPQRETRAFQNAGADSQKIDSIGQAGPNAVQPAKDPERDVFNHLAASAFLRFATLNPQKAANANVCCENAFSFEPATTPTSAKFYETASMDSGQRAGSLQDLRRAGSLSAHFESGKNGVGTIGYDQGGGTSYGVYQIASRPGTMDNFLDYLDDRAHQWAARLRGAGQADTGSTDGAMPREWKRIAAEDPERFAQFQQDFIQKTHYLPAMKEISRRTGLDMSRQPHALQEVLWSTAVQHGPHGAANIFCKAIAQDGAPALRLPARDVITSVYAARVEYTESMTSDVQDAVWKRFQEEKSMALAMLATEIEATEIQA